MKLFTRLSCIAIAMFPALTYVNGQTAATTEQTNPPAESQVSLGENVKMKIGGFARADFFYDTHKNVELLDGLLDMYPLNKSLDANGKDINDVSLLRMSAAASRLNTKFTGPDFLNAKTSSLIEFDFTGVNGIGLRLRHAWVKLNWEKSELLFGRFWHPMFILDAFPTVLALSTGAPFCVFNRAEQLRFTYNLGQISFMAAAAGQMDYGFSNEYSAASGATSYLHNQIMPDITVNAQFKNDNIIFGASANYKVNQPRLYTQDASTPANKYKTDEKIASLSAQAYAQYKTGLLKIKGSALYGENMMELLMMGGYAVKSVEPKTFKETYSTVKNLNYWCNIVYGDKLQAILFVGYMQNLGTSDKQIAGFTKSSARGYDDAGNGIANMIRIAPSVAYKVGKVQIHLELEHSITAYGKYTNATNVINENAEVKDTKNISNTRVQFATIFYF